MLAFISWLIGRLQTRAELELEVIALRHQLAVLRRQRPDRPCFSRWTDSFGSGSTGCGRDCLESDRAGQAGHRGSMASPRLSALLALAVTVRTASGRSRGS